MLGEDCTFEGAGAGVVVAAVAAGALLAPTASLGLPVALGVDARADAAVAGVLAAGGAAAAGGSLLLVPPVHPNNM